MWAKPAWNYVLKAVWMHGVAPQLPVPTGGAGVPVTSLLLSSAVMDTAGLEVKAFFLGLHTQQDLMFICLFPSQLKHSFLPKISLKYQTAGY